MSFKATSQDNNGFLDYQALQWSRAFEGAEGTSPKIAASSITIAGREQEIAHWDATIVGREQEIARQDATIVGREQESLPGMRQLQDETSKLRVGTQQL